MSTDYILDKYQDKHQRLLASYLRRDFEAQEVLVSQDGVSCVIDFVHTKKIDPITRQLVRLTVNANYHSETYLEIPK